MAAHAPRAAVFLDYDGTLAPIVTDPSRAVPLPGVPAVLGQLTERYGLVAVVSGRPVAYLLSSLGPLPGIHLAGLYGLEERAPGDEVRPHPDVAAWEPVMDEVVARARAAAPPGLLVEPKRLTVTLHWRAHPELAGWALAFADEARRLHGLEAHPGRMEIELRPPVAADKGTVVGRLAPGHRAAACFGDDLGDLPAFAALDALRPVMAVARVGVADAETPVAVRQAADLVVEGPEGALAVLRSLVAESAG